MALPRSERRRRPPPALAAAALLLCATGAAPGGAPAAFDPARSDPRAIAVADLVLQALGGRQAWEQTRFIHFAFVVQKGEKRLAERTHLWDRWSGRLRYENVDRDGRPFVALLNVDTRQGSVHKDGAALPDAAAKPLLDQAYEAWINDTYWLLMPYKMKDPGVRLAYAGEVTENGVVYDRVELTFDGVGLTPRDRYWAYVNRATHLMDRWSYVLQDDPPGREPTVWDWKGWTLCGRILLSPEKVSERREQTIRILHPVLEVYEALPDVYFARPDPLPDRLASPGRA
ncbi:MAG: hypothetical protein HY510_06645 [Acidobacteria bacterium]|nr:hypothetical protein [Acidobacteriota bacterium]